MRAQKVVGFLHGLLSLGSWAAIMLLGLCLFLIAVIGCGFFAGLVWRFIHDGFVSYPATFSVIAAFIIYSITPWSKEALLIDLIVCDKNKLKKYLKYFFIILAFGAVFGEPAMKPYINLFFSDLSETSHFGWDLSQ